MAESTTVFIDATFGCSPRVTSADDFNQRQVQVLNIIAEFHGVNIPVLYVVMATKQYRLYKKVFRKIYQVCQQFRPQFAMTDWESGMRKAIKTELLSIRRLLGCR